MAFDVKTTKIELSATDKTKVAFDSVRSNLNGLESGVSGLMGRFGGLVGILGVGAFATFTKRIIDQADSMNDLSKRTGIAVEQIGAWRLATEQSGTSMDALTQALGKGAKYLVTHGDDLKKIGINAKTSEELILQLSGVISKMPSDDPRRTALAMQVLGRSAGELIPLLSEGEQGLRKMLETGRAANPYTKELAENSDKLKDSLSLLSLQASRFSVALVTEAVPGLNQIIEKMKDATKEGGILKGMFAGLAEAGKITLFGSDDALDKKRINQISNEISSKSRLLAGSTTQDRDATGALISRQLTNTEKYSLGLDLKQLANESNNLSKKLGLIKSEIDSNPALSDAQDKGLKGFLKTDSAGSTKPKADTIGDRIRALAFENKLLAQGVPLEDARTIARLKGDKATDAQIVQILNATAVQTQFEAAEKASQKTKEDLIKTTEGYAEAMLKLSDASFDAVKNAQDEAAAQERNLQIMQLGESAVIRMDAARLSEAAASAEQGLAYAKLNGLSAENISFVETEILRIKQLAAERLRLANGQDAQTAFEKDKQRIEDLAKAQDDAFKKTEQDVQRTADSIYNSITDSLVRSFEKGEGSFKNFLKGLQNTAKTAIIRLGIDFAMNASGLNGLISQVARMVSGAGGSAGGAGSTSGNGGNSIFGQIKDIFSTGNNSIIGSIGSLGQTLSAFGSGGTGILRDIASSVGSFTQLNAGLISKAAPYAGAVLQLAQGNIAGAAFTAIGTAIGGPIGGAIGGLVGSLFGKKKVPRFSTLRAGEYDNGVFSARSAGQQYKALGAETQIDGLSEQFAKSLGSFLTGFGLDDKISTTSSLFKKRKASYGNFSADFDGGSVTAGTTGKAKNVQDTFARLVETVLGGTLAEAITKSKAVAGIKDLFAGLTDKAVVASLILATTSLNAQEVALNRNFGLTVDVAGRVVKASGAAGQGLADFATKLAAIAQSTQTVGDILVKSRAGISQRLGEVYGDIITDAVNSTVTRQVPITGALTSPRNGALGFGGIGGFGVRQPAASNTAFAGIAQNLLGLPQQFRTITEQVTTYVDRIIARTVALPQSLAEYDAAIKAINTTTAAGIKQVADLIALRDGFGAYTQAIDGLKAGVAGATFGLRDPAQQAALLQTQYADLFKRLGIAAPQSMQGLLGLADGIDYTTKAGLDLAAAFPSLVDQFNATKEGIDSLTDSLREGSKFKTQYDYDFYKGIANNYGSDFANRFTDGANVSYGASNNTSVALSPISPSNNTTISTSDPNMLTAMNTLIAKVNTLQAELVTIKSNTASAARTLQNASRDDNAFYTKAAA